VTGESSTVSGDSRSARATFRYSRLLRRNREFRGIVLAQVTSEVGDHFARFALAALVLDRSDSVFYAAFAFVVGYIPGLFGGLLLSPFADRVPRKRVLIVCDLVRAAVVGVLALAAVDATPLWVLFALLLFAELFSQPFFAARSAVMPDVLVDPQDYMVGSSLTRGLNQANQVIGLAAAGVVVHAFSPRIALAVDALTFLASYLVIQLMLRSRAALMEGRGGLRGLLVDTAEGVKLVFFDQVRRSFVLLVWATIGFLIAPEAVALAYSRDHGAADLGGFLMAAVPAGAVAGVALVSRLDPLSGVRLSPLLAAASLLPLVVTAANPDVPVAMALWFISGALQAFIVPMIVGVNLVTPPEARGRVNGVAAAGLSLFTAAGFALAGRLADVTSPAAAVGIAGVAGLFFVGLLAMRWPQAVTELSTRSASAPEPASAR
jgi:hypothetical protein